MELRSAPPPPTTTTPTFTHCCCCFLLRHIHFSFLSLETIKVVVAVDILFSALSCIKICLSALINFQRLSAKKGLDEMPFASNFLHSRRFRFQAVKWLFCAHDDEVLERVQLRYAWGETDMPTRQFNSQNRFFSLTISIPSFFADRRGTNNNR